MMPYLRHHFIILLQLICTIISKIKMPVRCFNAEFVLYRWLACGVCRVLRTQQRWPTMFSWMDRPFLGPVQQRPSAVWTPRPWLSPWDTLCKFRLNVSLCYFPSRLWNCICVVMDIKDSREMLLEELGHAFIWSLKFPNIVCFGGLYNTWSTLCPDTQTGSKTPL